MTYRFSWDFGDGDNATPDGTHSGYSNELHGFNAAHIYRNPYTYSITRNIILTVENPATGTTLTSQAFTVTIRPEADQSHITGSSVQAITTITVPTSSQLLTKLADL